MVSALIFVQLVGMLTLEQIYVRDVIWVSKHVQANPDANLAIASI